MEQNRRNHSGAQISFGEYGYLYVGLGLGLGDGVGAGDPLGHAEDTSNILN